MLPKDQKGVAGYGIWNQKSHFSHSETYTFKHNALSNILINNTSHGRIFTLQMVALMEKQGKTEMELFIDAWILNTSCWYEA